MARTDYYHESNSPRANLIVPAASAIVVNNKGKLLLHKRKDNQLWSLPGGVMEIGETIEDAIMREVKEETGFITEVKKLVGVYTDPQHLIEYSDGEVRQQFSICFECHIICGEKFVSHESTCVEFFSKEQLSKMNLHPAQSVRINDFFRNQERAFIR
ncbi:NUDIX domain-containing protein [Thermoactinomyces sp. DSM 45892]|uniref:NUDIX domain-containing protein n=1 Tax=Thermoactinomyces sp. DSM 45892 TaxID=1882753 RepID=UPI00089BFE33|nr:NUDIX domain-containing protein [Thermoactinomyces sp. DSM 45892]SDZ36209.1 NUDIX domain-containing protein [Thermoactinomyces sp. DSM 45892]